MQSGNMEIKDKLFNKYDYDVEISDETMKDYINLRPSVLPHTFGRVGKRKKRIEKNIVERLVNKLMRGGTGEKVGGKLIRTHGKLQGKKTRVIKIVEEAFDIIHEKTKQNPIQYLIKAIENSAPREDVTRVEYGGVRYQVAVDVSPKRRVDMALRNISLAAIISSFDKKATLAEALANEIILAATGDVNSYAIKKKDETERMARSAR
ncbi:MAG: 30S ribosomal protein S7 [Candidatus Micrarchaeota archaeon]|nr:30S ribosomal protein S7 [Candidatus Micrarchaeota archaeon]